MRGGSAMTVPTAGRDGSRAGAGAAASASAAGAAGCGLELTGLGTRTLRGAGAGALELQLEPAARRVADLLDGARRLGDDHGLRRLARAG